MKKKMLVERLTALSITTVFASGIAIQPISAYGYSLEPNYIIQNINNQIQVNEYSIIGGVKSYKQLDNKVTFEMTTGEKVRVSVLDNDIFRIYMDPSGVFQEDATPNSANHTTKIIEKKESEYTNVQPTVQDGDIIKVSTEAIELRIEKSTGKMELINKKNNKIIWKEAEPLKYKSDETIQTLEANEDEYFYGGGQQNGRFSHKGKTINIKNENNWVDGGVSSPTPFYFSTNGYGVMRNTFKPGQYDFESTEEGKVLTKHSEKRFDAYYFIDETPTNIINKFTDLTGKAILLPEYSFYIGHANAYARDWVNDETGQESQTQKAGFDRQETLMVDAKKVIDEHISNDMPIGWFLPNDGYGAGYGRADTIDGNIALLKEFVDYSKSKGVQVGLWTQSSLKPTGVGEAYLQRDIDKEVGVAGTNAVKTDVAWVGAGYSFALNAVRQAAEGIENNSVDRARPFVISLDGWAGTQRYAGIWSGDQYGGNWEYIRFHIPTYIGSGLSGQPNVGSDIDGIFGGNSLIQTRDIQWKAFTPIEIDMDGWGSNDKTPYVFGEPYTSINRMYLKLKAEMMPYNYTIANEATTDGVPMIRAMMLEYPNEYTYGTDTQYQYMWGENLLVAPIYQNTSSDSKGNDIRNDIYLPDEDQIWIDYFTGKQYRGGGVLNNFDAPVWKLPLFVKNGAIIPMANENNNPEEIDDSQRKFEVYPSGNTSFEVYEDDGLTTDYKEGKSATTVITSSAPKSGKGKAVIKAGLLKGDYEGIVTERTTEFTINASEKPTDLSLKVGNKNISMKEAASLEEFNNGTNLYFYDESPNLNKYSIEESDFQDVEIITTPKLYVKAEKTDVTINTVELTINDFVNAQDISKNELNTDLSTPTNFTAPKELITSNSINLTWDKVEGAESYEVEIDGIIQKNILSTQYIHNALDFDTEYNYRIRSVNKDGYSAWSNKLTVKTNLDPYRNVPKNMTVTWSEGNYSSDVAANAIDGNDTSQFHSAGNAIDKPFIIDMQKAYQIDKLDLLFRNNGNGSVKRAEIYSSIDGVNYQKVFTNASDSGNTAWVTDGEVKTINFTTPVKARYFKIVTKESIGNFLTMKEFRPYMVDGTKGQIVGDWNNGGTLEEGDLTFLQNYTGLSSVDADWNYVSMADLNFNNIIDAYDINYVASKLDGGITPTKDKKIAGEIMLSPSKTSISAGETFTVDIVGTNLSDVNGFSVEIPLDSSKYELVKTPEATLATAEMKNLSKLRLHTDNKQDIYVVFANTGNKTRINGTDTISRVTLKAKSDITFDLKATNVIIVDSNSNSKNAIANVKNTEEALPEGQSSVAKVVKENITVTGDESQLQSGMGLSKLIDGTTSSDDSSRMDLKWVYTSTQVDKGKLPFEMTFTFNEAKKFNNFTIYNRVNTNGSNNIAALKKVKAVGYLNGVATDLGEKVNITTSKTIYELNNQSFDKIVITALESNKDINTLAINEIEFYEEKMQLPSSIQFTADKPSSLYINKLTPISAKVLPENANNLYYKITSSNEDVVKVIRIDSNNKINYYLRGIKAGTATVKVTTADGKLSAEYEVSVIDGFDKTKLIEAIESAKSYEKLSEIYTKETYSALLEVIKNGEETLENAKSEGELSESIIDIRTTINALKERSTVDSDRIDFNKSEAIFATTEADSDFKENAVDGDENTIWHSGYQSSDKVPVSIVVKLDKAYNLNQIDYLPRQNSKNGHVTEYLMETSLDNKNWTEVRKGTLKEASNGSGLENKGYSPIRFNSTKAQYVRFTALKTLGDTRDKYASIAELRFYGQLVPVEAESIALENDELNIKANTTEKLIPILNPIDSSDKIVWTSADKNIVIVDENGNVTAIEVGTTTIIGTIENGKNVVATINVLINKDELNLEILESEKIINEEGSEDKYSKTSWEVFKKAYDSALALEDDVTQKQVNEVKESLNSARKTLALKTNKEGLQAKLEEANELILETSKYSKASLNKLNAEVEKAKALLLNETSNEEDFATSNKAIIDAIESLFDTTEANKALEDANLVEEDEYTKDSYKKFLESKLKLQELLLKDDASAEDIEQGKLSLINKMYQLIKLADKSALSSKISEAETLVEKEYTADSFKTFKLALNAANEIFENEEATQKQVDEAVSILEDAIKQLVKSSDEKPVDPSLVDKSNLGEIINKANTLNKDKYTEETWKKLQEALDNAKEVLNNTDAKEEEVNLAIKNLDNAINELQDIKITPATPPVVPPATSSSTTNITSDNSNNSGKLPNTGDTVSGGIALFGIVASLLGTFMIKKRRKSKE
ncbi:discoidin domain-containing protein [uncultured Clostridium sp.]|uniref:discoidin domain-containing protein n=1 Tax=uncultured Clostridium sp. TaxID=59620 RepID=UPI00280AC8B8|nr:discoidin domain-containing protein [uncultured Clostridium sp.]